MKYKNIFQLTIIQLYKNAIVILPRIPNQDP